VLHITLEEVLAAEGGVRTECAYIVPRDRKLARRIIASVLAVLKRFGYNVDNLNGEKVHSLFNVVTMEKDAQDNVNRLEIWFEKTLPQLLQTTRYLMRPGW